MCLVGVEGGGGEGCNYIKTLLKWDWGTKMYGGMLLRKKKIEMYFAADIVILY